MGSRQTQQVAIAAAAMYHVEEHELVPYIAGYTLRKTADFTCESCRQLVFTQQSSSAFFHYKSYTDSVHGLSQPSSTSASAFVQMERVFREAMAASSTCEQLMEIIVGRFRDEGLCLPFCNAHTDANSRAMQLFCRIRLHHWCRLRMRRFCAYKESVAATRKLRKL